MRKSFASGLCLFIATLLLVGCASAPRGDGGWLAAWASAQLEQTPPPNVQALWRQPMRDVSLRQIVRVDAAGSALRVRISNLFGAEPLTVGAVTVALADGVGVKAASLQSLSFGGRREVVVPAHAEVWSDPIDFAVARQADLAVQMYVQAGPSTASVHPGSRIRSWAVDGNRVVLADWPGAVAQEGWWHLAAVDVRAARPAPVLVATGDSITDGYGVPSGTYQRWTDALSRRLEIGRAHV